MNMNFISPDRVLPNKLHMNFDLQPDVLFKSLLSHEISGRHEAQLYPKIQSMNFEFSQETFRNENVRQLMALPEL